MNDEVVDLSLTHPTQRIQQLIAGYIYAVYLVQISARPQAEKWKIIKELTELGYDWRSAGHIMVSRARLTASLALVHQAHPAPVAR
jgi:phospholipase/lecithinase/hemolysin